MYQGHTEVFAIHFLLKPRRVELFNRLLPCNHYSFIINTIILRCREGHPRTHGSYPLDARTDTN